MKRTGFILGAITASALLLAFVVSRAQYNGLYDGSFPYCPDTGGQHLNWNGNLPAGGPVCGTSGAAPAIGTPNTLSMSLATAYQATNSAKPAFVTITLSSSAQLTISGGQTQTAQIVIGSTSAVASGTGTAIGTSSNSQTGTVVVGVALTAGMTGTTTIALPAGWYFAVRQTSGTVSIASAFDQSIG